MARTRTPKDDPVVAEVRRWRARVWKKGGGTFEGLFELARRAAEAHRSARRKPKKRRRSA